MTSSYVRKAIVSFTFLTVFSEPSAVTGENKCISEKMLHFLREGRGAPCKTRIFPPFYYVLRVWLFPIVSVPSNSLWGVCLSPPPSPRPAPHSINSTHILHAYVYGSPLYGWETLRKPGSRSIWSRLLAYVRISICGCLVIILPLCVYCLDLDCSVFLSITELMAGHETGLLFGMELCLLLGMKLCLLLGMQLSLLLDMKLCLYFRKERCYC
jgi:hypothetical protein